MWTYLYHTLNLSTEREREGDRETARGGGGGLMDREMLEERMR